MNDQNKVSTGRQVDGRQVTHLISSSRFRSRTSRRMSTVLQVIEFCGRRSRPGYVRASLHHS